MCRRRKMDATSWRHCASGARLARRELPAQTNHMRRWIHHIAGRFALLLALAAVLPLVAYGVVSIFSLQRGTRQEVIQGNENVAIRAGEEIRRYVTTNAELLNALAANLQDTGLTQMQQDRILKNYVLQIREFREISLFDEQGAVVASSRIGKP